MTREEELMRIAKKLDKMVSRNNTEGALDLLKELKSFNMTLKLLQETRIGMSVNGIRKHSTDEEVTALAKFLIKDWKRLLESGNNEKSPENGMEPVRAESPTHSSPRQSHSRRLDLKQDSDPDTKPSDGNRKEKLNNDHKPMRIYSSDETLPSNETHPQTKPQKHLEDDKKQRATEQRQQEADVKRPKHFPETQGEKLRADPKRERPSEEHRVMRKDEERREWHPDTSKRHSSMDDKRRSREEHHIEIHKPLPERHEEHGQHRERPVEIHRQLPERREEHGQHRKRPVEIHKPLPERHEEHGQHRERPVEIQKPLPERHEEHGQHRERPVEIPKPLPERREEYGQHRERSAEIHKLHPERHEEHGQHRERPVEIQKLLPERHEEYGQHRERSAEIHKLHPERREEYGQHREQPVEIHKPLFERKSVLDSLYPSRYPSPPRPVRPPPPRPVMPVRPPTQDAKKDRKEKSKNSHKHSHSEASKPARPVIKRPSLEIKRNCPPDPNAPIAPLPLHLHPPPPPARKEPPDPNAPLPPLPLHLHPPPPPKRPSVEAKKERKESTEAKTSSQKKSADVKKERRESSEGKVSKKHSGETKRDRVDSNDSLKKNSTDVKKDVQRKESSDAKPAHPQKRPSSDSKPDRRESSDSKRSSSPPAKKLSTERRESHGSKAVQSGAPHRKPSTDSTDGKGKVDVPKTPTTPTSPMSPGSAGPLSPHLSTGDSVRDKCIEMITAALRTDNDYKVFGVNCDSMAAEIEDHIYQEIKATDMKYKNRVRSRISNLKDPKNPGLRKNVLAGTIELSRIASMTAEEMASDELKQLRNVMTQEAIREHQMAKTGGTTTDLLQCGKCKKKNCTYNQVQTRSADEPMTTFVLCNECGNRWKFC